MKLKHLILISLFLPAYALAQTAIGEQTYRYNDTARKRPLVTEVWYPTTDRKTPALKENFPFIVEPTIRNATLPAEKHPLIMISHGTGGGRLTMEWLADALVKQGFIVAAVDHWGNTYDNKIAIDFLTPWQRAQDISFVLTQLLNDTALDKVIDRQRIGAAGFSIGGFTVIALAGAKVSLDAMDAFNKTPQGIREITIPEFPDLINKVDEKELAALFAKSPPLKDKRIKAVLAMSPAVGQGFVSPAQFKDVDIPMYIISAQSDSIAPVKTNAAHYLRLMPKSKLYVVPGKAGHYVFLNEAIPEVKKTGGIIFNDDPAVSRSAVHERVGNMAAKFFKESLK
ncbi:alpha/beta fold hydrolase [Mucilaginibacter sp. AK015]|uniref:alpha/beta hydrolase family protein n=1 Tax=Mucilaginibacter sp. AK015 TaxID=2723072 RepID=UPI00161CDDB2|nr:alpha/beta fold hydrolase [Mucilaginibacter sp. AK015]MBB5394870.1 putative dienelactone hydrolase [Mucilaginibacter sp. AK015]